MARREAIAGIIDQFSGKRRKSGTLADTALARGEGGEPLLDLIPGFGIDDCGVMTHMDLVAVANTARIDRIGQDVVNVGRTKRRGSDDGVCVSSRVWSAIFVLASSLLLPLPLPFPTPAPSSRQLVTPSE